MSCVPPSTATTCASPAASVWAGSSSPATPPTPCRRGSVRAWPPASATWPTSPGNSTPCCAANCPRASSTATKPSACRTSRRSPSGRFSSAGSSPSAAGRSPASATAPCAPWTAYRASATGRRTPTGSPSPATTPVCRPAPHQGDRPPDSPALGHRPGRHPCPARRRARRPMGPSPRRHRRRPARLEPPRHLFLTVTPVGSGPAEGTLVDTDGVLLPWMRRHGAAMLALRPDAYVYAAASGGALLPPPPQGFTPSTPRRVDAYTAQ